MTCILCTELEQVQLYLSIVKNTPHKLPLENDEKPFAVLIIWHKESHMVCEPAEAIFTRWTPGKAGFWEEVRNVTERPKFAAPLQVSIHRGSRETPTGTSKETGLRMQSGKGRKGKEEPKGLLLPCSRSRVVAAWGQHRKMREKKKKRNERGKQNRCVKGKDMRDKGNLKRGNGQKTVASCAPHGDADACTEGEALPQLPGTREAFLPA